MASSDGPTVHPIDLGFVNAYLVRGERPILVDAGLPDHAQDILEALEAHHVDPQEIALILLTHGHLDHFGGAATLKTATGAPVAVHEADAAAVRRGQNPPLVPTGVLGWLIKPFTGAGDGQGLDPDILLEGHESLERFGVQGRLVPTPGHTPGSVSLDLDGGSCIVGDLVSRSLRKHTPGLPPFAEDVDQLRRSVALLLEHEPRRIYAGHGGPFVAEDVRRRLL